MPDLSITERMRRRNAGQTVPERQLNPHQSPGFTPRQFYPSGQANQPNYDSRTNGGIPRRGG